MYYTGMETLQQERASQARQVSEYSLKSDGGIFISKSALVLSAKSDSKDRGVMPRPSLPFLGEGERRGEDKSME